MSIANNILSAEDWVDKKRMVTVSKKAIRGSTILHMHDYFEIEMIIDGHGVQNLNGDIYDLKKDRYTFYRLSISIA